MEELLKRLRLGDLPRYPAPGPRPVVPVVEVMCFCPNCDEQVTQGAPVCIWCRQVFQWPFVALVEGGRN